MESVWLYTLSRWGHEQTEKYIDDPAPSGTQISLPGLLGLGVFLAIALHKPLDALPITSMMQAGGWVEIWSIDKKSYYGHSSFNSFFKNSR